MKQVISLIIIGVLVWGGWELWQLGQKYRTGQDLQEAQQAAAARIDPGQLPGMPQQWEAAYKAATNGGVKSWTAWMKTYAQRVDDPRRAWIEMDYMVKISVEDPQEAKSIFAGVKERTPTNSPIYPRIQQLEKTYE